jgi:hypothetical protein
MEIVTGWSMTHRKLSPTARSSISQDVAHRPVVARPRMSRQRHNEAIVPIFIGRGAPLLGVTPGTFLAGDRRPND